MRNVAVLLLLLSPLVLATTDVVCKEEWFKTDFELLTSKPAQGGWWIASDSDNVIVEERKIEGSGGWDLFRIAIPTLHASAEKVFDTFVNNVLTESHKWTKEFKVGKVIAKPNEHTRIIYMEFDSGVPLVDNRDLCYVECTRDLGNGIKQASFRSVDACGPSPKGATRITWWGANLFAPQGDNKSSWILIDQENQGGYIPAFAMNLAMPKYLREEYKALEKLFGSGDAVQTNHFLAN
eukprot:GILJ01000128.1.p1 GENE.GILJ01000128.1~~GILJ01000128.1.p1  ORF type:complete len:250 (+),score=48.97 GILJ01000128.1:42-752(+)